ncbi:LIM and SH3 domain protein 1-like isoform X3 [Watersipora subatra]|uniref:LIM and SH3 domain protein 1-like isoform X3 n=1 Tax=Watersipora subatra TaxID=2589382 RepID=UPI00355C0E62
MPPKACAACQKSVFPMEELKCLDKTWHKGCFKCQVCNMTLNMKNYKGYNKLPYCNAHYPETKFTAVADTPEAKRLAQNSKIQSNITYHAEYEKERGQYTAVADDPETLRVKKNMSTISNVAYHGDLIRRQEMENTRPNEYEPSESLQPSHEAPPMSYTAPPSQQQRLSTSSQGQQSQQPVLPPSQSGYARRPGSINDYDPRSGPGQASSPYSSKPQSTTAYNSQQQGSQGQMQPQVRQPPQQQQPAMPPPQQRAPPPQSRDPYYGKGKVSKSMYDYTGADDDEVSFLENDIIIHCTPIDEGWMTGTVERTNEHGMLPSNYVEHLNW